MMMSKLKFKLTITIDVILVIDRLRKKNEETTCCHKYTRDRTCPSTH